MGNGKTRTSRAVRATTGVPGQRHQPHDKWAFDQSAAADAAGEPITVHPSTPSSATSLARMEARPFRPTNRTLLGLMLREDSTATEPAVLEVVDMPRLLKFYPGHDYFL